MASTVVPAGVLRFGNFELDLKNGELRRSGVLIKLPPQPMAVLQMLAENAGELVTREQIQRQVWGTQTFVDFDRSLNVCMAQIRGALNDDADAPRFIRTVPKRGYMFLPPVEKAPVDTPPVRRAWPIWALVAISIAATGFFIGRARVADDRVMLAVLPFDGDATLDDAMTEELISHLGSVQSERLGVIATGSVMRYKTARPPLRDIARDLNINYLVEGTARREADRVRITARLVKVADQSVVWTESYEDVEVDRFRIEQDAAARISAGVLLRLFPQAGLRSPTMHSAERGAFEAYRTARSLQLQGSRSAVQRSVDLFEEAVKIDPRYAEAFAGLADSCVTLARSGLPPREFMPRAAAAASKALALDESSAEAHNALGNVRMWSDWNWRDAEQQFARAVSINPSYAAAHHDFAWLLIATGRTEGGLTSLRRAIALDPLSVRINMDAGWLLLQAHRFDDAIRQARRALELDPELREAAACIARAQFYKSGGKLGPIPRGDPYWTAVSLAASGENVQAIAALEQAFEGRSFMMPAMKSDPAFISLHSDARFQQLAGKMGL